MTETKTYCHIFDKGCHQPWYAEGFWADHLIVSNDGGDRMLITRPGSDSPYFAAMGGFRIMPAEGPIAYFESLEQAATNLSGSDIYHYLEDALVIRREEYAS